MRRKIVKSLVLCWLSQPIFLFANTWNCEILPAEQKIEIDAGSGATILFATTNPASDRNLYFHDRCFMEKMLLFVSDRFGRTEVMGYLFETGELVRLNQRDSLPAATPLASRKGDRLYVTRQNGIYEWQLEISTQSQTVVRIIERKLTEIPRGAIQQSGLAENCDATLLAFAYHIESDYYIAVFDFNLDQVQIAAKLAFEMNHLQFHWHRPDILSFSRTYESDFAPLDSDEPPHARFWFLNVYTRMPVPAFYQVPGELVTHECWWINDQITFIGGHHRIDTREEGHVKVLDVKTGDIRIIGAGAWWDEGTASQLAKVNWWHASGSPDGKWVAADNWHGVVALFNAKTTEKKILTTGHRTYGGGAHLHVGWDLFGERVEFTSNKLGNADVCIGIIPKDW